MDTLANAQANRKNNRGNTEQAGLEQASEGGWLCLNRRQEAKMVCLLKWKGKGRVAVPAFEQLGFKKLPLIKPS
eukprot:1160428-Pelagomonas_calceolata.AAC.20